MSSHGDEAQRELERRALRNVRGLVDKLEQTDEADSRTQKRMLVGILAIAALVVVAIAATILMRDEGSKPIVIDPAKLPPVQAGPPRK